MPTRARSSSVQVALKSLSVHFLPDMGNKNRRGGTTAQKWSLYTKDGVIDIRLIWSYLSFFLLWLWHYISYIGYLYPGRYVKTTRSAYVITENGDVVYNPTYGERLANFFQSDASIKRRLLSWIQDLLPNFRVSNFTLTWSDGIVLCALIDAVCPGSCPRHEMLKPQQKANNCRLALRLAKKHLGIPPCIITPEEMAKGKDSMEMKMRQLLSLVKYLATQNKHKPLTERIKYITRDSSIDRVISRCKARGSGLKVGNVGRRSTFTITIASEEMMDLLIEISGPKGEFCAEIIRSAVTSRNMGKMFDGEGHVQSQIEQKNFDSKETLNLPLGKWNSAGMITRQRSFDGEFKDAPKIPFDYQLIRDGKFLVSFIPRSVGIHTLHIKWQGRGIKGSPFEVAVNKPRERRFSYSLGKENTFSTGDSTSDEASNGGLEADDDYGEAMVATKVSCGRKVLGQIPNEGQVQKALVKQGTVTRRRILKRVITKAGQDIVIQEAEANGGTDKFSGRETRSWYSRSEEQRSRSNNMSQLGLFESVAHQIYKRHVQMKNPVTEKKSGVDVRHQADKLNEDFQNVQKLVTFSESDQGADVNIGERLSSEGCNYMRSSGNVTDDHIKRTLAANLSDSIEELATQMGEQILENVIFDARACSIPSKRLNNAHSFRPVSQDSQEGNSTPPQENRGGSESSNVSNRGHKSYGSMDAKKAIIQSHDIPQSNRVDGAISLIANDSGRRSPYSLTAMREVNISPNKNLLTLPWEKPKVNFKRRPSDGCFPVPHPIIATMQKQTSPISNEESVFSPVQVQFVSSEQRLSCLNQDSVRIDEPKIGSNSKCERKKDNRKEIAARSTMYLKPSSDGILNEKDDTITGIGFNSNNDLHGSKGSVPDGLVPMANIKVTESTNQKVLARGGNDHSTAEDGPFATGYDRIQRGKDSISKENVFEEGQTTANRRRHLGIYDGSFDRNTDVGTKICQETTRDSRNLKILQSPSMTKTCYFNAQKAFSGSDRTLGEDLKNVLQNGNLGRGHAVSANDTDIGHGISDSIDGASNLSSLRDRPSSTSAREATADDDTNSCEDIMKMPLRAYSSMPLLRSKRIDIDSETDSTSQDEQQRIEVPKHRKLRKHNTISGPDPDLSDSIAMVTPWKDVLEYWTTKPQHVGFDDEGLIPTFRSAVMSNGSLTSSHERESLDVIDQWTQVSASEIKLETNWKEPDRYIKFRRKFVKMPQDETQDVTDRVFTSSECRATPTKKRSKGANVVTSTRHLHPEHWTHNLSSASDDDNHRETEHHLTRQSTFETGDSGIAEETNGGISPQSLVPRFPARKMIEGHRAIFRKPYRGRILLDPLLTSDTVAESLPQRMSLGRIAVSRSRSGSDSSVAGQNRNKSMKKAPTLKKRIVFSKRIGVHSYSTSSSGSRSSFVSSRQYSSRDSVNEQKGSRETVQQEVMADTIQENEAISDDIAHLEGDNQWTDDCIGNNIDREDDSVTYCEKWKLKFKCECSKYLTDKEKYLPFFGELFPSELCQRCRERVTELHKALEDAICPLAQSNDKSHCEGQASPADQHQNHNEPAETNRKLKSLDKDYVLTLSTMKKAEACMAESWNSELANDVMPPWSGKASLYDDGFVGIVQSTEENNLTSVTRGPDQDNTLVSGSAPALIGMRSETLSLQSEMINKPGQNGRQHSEVDPATLGGQFHNLFAAHVQKPVQNDLARQANTCEHSDSAKHMHFESPGPSNAIDHNIPGSFAPVKTCSLSSLSLEESYRGFGMPQVERSDMLGALNAFSDIDIAKRDQVTVQPSMKFDSAMTSGPDLFSREKRFRNILRSKSDKEERTTQTLNPSSTDGAEKSGAHNMVDTLAHNGIRRFDNLTQGDSTYPNSCESESASIELNVHNPLVISHGSPSEDQHYGHSARENRQVLLGVKSTESPECAGIPNVRFNCDSISQRPSSTEYGLHPPSICVASEMSSDASEIGSSFDLNESTHVRFKNAPNGNEASKSNGSKARITLPEQSASSSFDITDELHVRFGNSKASQQRPHCDNVLSQIERELGYDRPYRGLGRHLHCPVTWVNSVASSASMSDLGVPQQSRRKQPTIQDDLSSFDDFLHGFVDDYAGMHGCDTIGSNSKSQCLDQYPNDYTQSTKTNDGILRNAMAEATFTNQCHEIQNGHRHELWEEFANEAFFNSNDAKRDNESYGEEMTSSPVPKNVSAFGSCLNFGQVAAKNNFQVKTDTAGNGTLAVSVKGPRPHTVTESSVTYTGDDLYEVTYEVTHPGYYIISVRWADINIPNSPFICKVTF